MPKRKSGQPVGSDIDWFVIPIERIRQIGIVLVIAAVVGGAGYFLYNRSRRTPEQKARAEIATASQLLGARLGLPGRRPAGIAPGAGARLAALGRGGLRRPALRRGLSLGRRVAVLLPPGARRRRDGGDRRRVVHLDRRGRVPAERRTLDLRTRPPAPGALRRRLRQDRPQRLGRDHVRRRDALHAPSGVALRSPPPLARGSGGQPGQDRVGRHQRLHRGVFLENRDGRGDGRRGPRLACRPRRRDGAEDRGDDLPRQDDGLHGEPDGGLERAGARFGRARRARSRRKSSSPRRRSRCCPRTTGSTI